MPTIRINMPSPTYEKTIAVLKGYIPEDRAISVLQRQLERCGATTDNFDGAHYAQVVNFIIGAATIYLLGNKLLRDELKDKLRVIQNRQGEEHGNPR